MLELGFRTQVKGSSSYHRMCNESSKHILRLNSGNEMIICMNDQAHAISLYFFFDGIRFLSGKGFIAFLEACKAVAVDPWLRCILQSSPMCCARVQVPARIVEVSPMPYPSVIWVERQRARGPISETVGRVDGRVDRKWS